MAETVGKIVEIGLGEDGITVRFDLPAGMVPAAGQYLLGAALDNVEILPVALYLTRADSDGSVFYGEFPTHWVPGVEVRLRGPFGRGFHLPSRARKVVLAALSGQNARLLPLAHQAVTQNAEVSLFCQSMPSWLPPEV